MSVGFMAFRKPSETERQLLRVLAARCVDGEAGWIDNVRVRSMNDGNMGSLRLRVEGALDTDQEFGARMAEYQFRDADGMQVIASLNVDKQGVPFELDIWKTDFSPLVEIPPDLDT